MSWRALLVALALVGCAQAEVIPPGAVDTSADVGGLEQSITGCEPVFSAAPELVDATQAAAVRWSAATGCNIHVGAGGALVMGHAGNLDALAGSSRPPEGLHALGLTDYAPLQVIVDTAQPADSVNHSVSHEMGHALHGLPGHSVDGLMQAAAPVGSKITDSTLALVCSAFDCAAFNPEEEP